MKKYMVTISAHESPEFGFTKEFENHIEVDDFMKIFEAFKVMTFRTERCETSLIEANGFHLTVQVIDRGVF